MLFDNGRCSAGAHAVDEMKEFLIPVSRPCAQHQARRLLSGKKKTLNYVLLYLLILFSHDSRRGGNSLQYRE